MLSKWKCLLVGLVLVALAVPQAWAASQDECAIWLCLPAGFAVPECGSAYKAMVRRVKDFKPPLPSFGSCAVKANDNSQMSYDYNYAAYVPERQACAEWVDEGESYYCGRYETIPEHYIKGTRCRTQKEDENTPDGCSGTVRYIDVFVDGQLAGDTYFWGHRSASRW